MLAFAYSGVNALVVLPYLASLLYTLSHRRYCADVPLNVFKNVIVRDLAAAEDAVQAVRPVLITADPDAMQELVWCCDVDDRLPWGLVSRCLHVGCEDGDKSQCRIMWHGDQCVFLCPCGKISRRIDRPPWAEKTPANDLWWVPFQRKEMEEAWLKDIVWMTPAPKVRPRVAAFRTRQRAN